MMQGKRSFYMTGVAVMALLIGCAEQQRIVSNYHPETKIPEVDAQALLDAEKGPWDIVEFEQDQNIGAPDSIHHLARNNVNPQAIGKRTPYIRKYDPRGEDIHYRILQIEPAAGSKTPSGYIYEDEGVASSLWPVPSHKPGTKPAVKTAVNVAKKVEKSKPVKVASVQNTTVRKKLKIPPSVRDAVSAVPSPAPKPLELEPAQKRKSKKRKSVSEDTISVAKIRFGNHPDKTRMVLDVSDKAEYNYAMNENGQVLEITLDQASWDAGQRLKILNHPYILGYSANMRDNKTVITIKLKEPGRVKWAAAFPPSESRGNRLIFDIATQS